MHRKNKFHYDSGFAQGLSLILYEQYGEARVESSTASKDKVCSG